MIVEQLKDECHDTVGRCHEGLEKRAVGAEDLWRRPWFGNSKHIVFGNLPVVSL